MRKALLVLLGLLTVAYAAEYNLLLLDDENDAGGSENMLNFEDDLGDWGIEFDHFFENALNLYSEDPTALEPYNIILWYNASRAISSSERDTLQTWVEEGNCLVVTGRDSIGLPNDPYMADLVNSTTNGDYLNADAFRISKEHWITSGPNGDFYNESYDLVETCRDCDNVRAQSPETLSLGKLRRGTLIGPDKIIVTEDVGAGNGIIVYWNGNADSREWWDQVYTPATWNMIHNCLDYMMDYVETNAVEPVSWGELKTLVD